ncbi:glycosyltransferase family 39 protein, partial [Rhodopseudomonas sp. B29]|uniref:glycosyltransferase family 39 protein n=1 Tax=Rhodopseudomonas sp. B29 TaxID=95607 RepID=UPI00131EF423
MSSRLAPFALLVGALDTLLQMLREQPLRLVMWLLGIYAALWLVAAISFPSLPAESYRLLALGSELQLGYAGVAPLAPWLANLGFSLSGNAAASQLVLAIGATLLTLILLWRLGSAIVGSSGAALAVALTLLIYQFGAPITAFDSATMTLPLWVAAVLAYRTAVLGGTRAAWAVLGALLAALIYAHHAGVALVIMLALHLLLTPQGRGRIRSAGPGVAAAITVVLLLPHLVWIFIAPTTAGQMLGLGARFGVAFGFVASQLGAHVLLIVVAALALVPRLPPQGEPVDLAIGEADRFDRSLIWAAAAVPSLLIAGWALVNGRPIDAQAGGAVVALSGLALVLLLPGRILPSIRLAVAVWLVALIGLPFGHAIAVYSRPVDSSTATELYPARALSEAMQRVWKTRTAHPLDIIAGSLPQAGFVAAYASPRPSVFIDADYTRSPWITPERLRQSGALIVWSTQQFRRTDEIPAPYRAAFADSAPLFGTMLLPLGGGKLE